MKKKTIRWSHLQKNHFLGITIYSSLRSLLSCFFLKKELRSRFAFRIPVKN